MKKFLTLFLALLAILPASADSYLALGNHDTLRIHPSGLDFYERVMVHGHFDGRLDHWDIKFEYPSWMNIDRIYKRGDMLEVPYLDSNGNLTSCNAPLYWNHMNVSPEDSLSCSITDAGYWDPDNDGIYETYGTVKWEAGDYSQMFEIYFNIGNADTLLYGNINFRCWLSSTDDDRGGTISDTSYVKNIYVYVGYLLGDVNGDDRVNIGDITDLIDIILNYTQLDIYQTAAADVDGNGIVDISDITALTDLINHSIYNELEDPSL